MMTQIIPMVFKKTINELITLLIVEQNTHKDFYLFSHCPSKQFLELKFKNFF